LKISKGGNQNPYIEEELTAQWPKEKGQTTIYKHTHKTKDRVTRTLLKSGVNSGAPEGYAVANNVIQIIQTQQWSAVNDRIEFMAVLE
jgi:hypothetical protein